jgi:hypothetical protein
VAALIIATAHLSPAWSAAVFSAATAIGTIFTAFQVRPVEVPAISGAATAVLGDLALLGLKVPPEVLGALTGAITFALGTVLHLMHVQYTSTASTSLTGTATFSPKQMRVLEQRVRASLGTGEPVVLAEVPTAAGNPPPGP